MNYEKEIVDKIKELEEKLKEYNTPKIISVSYTESARKYYDAIPYIINELKNLIDK